MKTDITTGISGTVGTPLAHQTIQSGRDAQKQISINLKSSDAISDTLETTDRDPDGRRSLVIEVGPQNQPAVATQPNEDSGIDLLG